MTRGLGSTLAAAGDLGGETGAQLADAARHAFADAMSNGLWSVPPWRSWRRRGGPLLPRPRARVGARPPGATSGAARTRGRSAGPSGSTVGAEAAVNVDLPARPSGREAVVRAGPRLPAARAPEQAQLPGDLSATLELLAEVGFAGLTIDGIAARAGVGKATIYRHWPIRAGLVLEAIGA